MTNEKSDQLNVPSNALIASKVNLSTKIQSIKPSKNGDSLSNYSEIYHNSQK